MDGDGTGGWSLPGYEIGSVLGRGGFSTVYRARQVSLGRDVAIKVLTTDLATEADRRRFDRERQVLARLSVHPSIVDVHDAGITPERRPYVVMRLYPGGTLAARLAGEGQLPVAQVVDIIAQIASALDAAHEAGVIHRDVKPENILLTEAGQPALADFGIAGIADPEGPRSHTSTTFFTLAHVAPEALEGSPYSVASDVYALASTTYMLLAGRPAFDPRNPRVASQILDTPPPPLARPDVPESLAAAVLAGMAKHPADRPGTATAFAATLSGTDPVAVPTPAVAEPAGPTEQVTGPAPTRPGAPARPEPPIWRPGPGPESSSGWSGGASEVPTIAAFPSPAGARSPGLLPPSGPGAGRDLVARPGARSHPHRRTVLTGLLLGACAGSTVTGATVYLTIRDRGDTSGGTAPQPTPLDGPVLKTLTGNTDAVGVVRYAPDGKTLVTACGDGTVRIWDATTGQTLKTLTGHTEYVEAAAFSPDGRTLATSSSDKTVRIWDATTGQSLKIFRGDADDYVEGVGFVPDGRALAVTSALGNAVRIWDAATSTRLKTLTGHTESLYEVAFSPDGRTLATGSWDKTVRIWDVATGQTLKTLTGHIGYVNVVVWAPDGRTLVTATGNSKDRVARVWDVATGQTIKTLTGHAGEVNAVAYAPDGRTLATASSDGTVRVWEVASGRPLKTLAGYHSAVGSVAYAPDGKTLATASWREVRIWAV